MNTNLPTDPNLTPTQEPVNKAVCGGDCNACGCHTTSVDEDSADPCVTAEYTGATSEVAEHVETNVSLANAFSELQTAMHQDPSYAWAWHCNLAMSFIDAGGDAITGNCGAARFMQTAFSIDTTKHEAFQALEKTWTKKSPPARPALCVNYADTPDMYRLAQGINSCLIPHSFWKMPVFVQDRSTCETDESLRQLIPYIVLRNKVNNTFFTYSRGKGGAEERLHSNLSIGLGGHIDDTPPKNTDLKAWCVQEARRELLEEVGLTVNVEIEYCALLCDDTNPVGRVHLGILAIVDVEPYMLDRCETDVIDNGEWLSLEQLQASTRLENWSIAALKVLERLPLE